MRSAFGECLSFAVRNAAGPEAGILGPRSLSWAVYREMSLLSCGGRALLLQLAHLPPDLVYNSGR